MDNARCGEGHRVLCSSFESIEPGQSGCHSTASILRRSRTLEHLRDGIDVRRDKDHACNRSSDSSTPFILVPGVLATVRDSREGHRGSGDAPCWRSQSPIQPSITEGGRTDQRTAGRAVFGRFCCRVCDRRLSRSHQAWHRCGDCSNGLAALHSDHDVHVRHHQVMDSLRAAANRRRHASRASQYRAVNTKHHARTSADNDGSIVIAPYWCGGGLYGTKTSSR